MAGSYIIEMEKYTFKKEERLCSKRSIDDLFHNGSSFVVYPFRVVYLAYEPQERPFPAQAILSVPKKRFKRAVDRNHLKRQMRECYRQQKHALYAFLQDNALHMSLAVQYVSNEKLPFETLKAKTAQLLARLEHEIDQSHLGKGN